jgi:bifunctional non-homologous end joining protein LigD
VASSTLKTPKPWRKLFEAVCNLGLEGIVSKRLTSVYRSGTSRTWIKVKNPNAPAATRALDGTF